MKNLGHWGCLVTILFVASACTKSEVLESEDLRTSGVYPEFSVLATGSGTVKASAKLKVAGDDSNTTLELTGQDRLLVSAGDDEAEMELDGTVYKATLGTDEDGTVFTFAFDRGEEDDSALDSHVTLPDAFDLEGASAGMKVSRSEDSLKLTWEPSKASDSHHWELDGDCLFETDGGVDEDGTLVLKGEDFNGTPSADEEGADADKANCEAVLCLERKLTGVLDPEFENEEGGEIRAIQRRCTKFTSTP